MSTGELLLLGTVLYILYLGILEYRGKKGEEQKKKGIELITTVIRRWWRQHGYVFCLLFFIAGYFWGHFIACPAPCP